MTTRAAGDGTMSVTVRAQPGASRTRVGGRFGDADPPVLIARVSARPVEGRANEALRRALADAFGVRPRAVRLVSGEAARLKVFELDGADPARLEELLRR